MSKTAAANFIDSVLLHWPPYRWDEEQEGSWTKSMIVELRGFGPPVLDKAITTMVRSRKDRRTPSIAECVQACVEAKRWIDIESGKQDLPIAQQKPTGEFTDDRVRLANDLVMSPLGKQAAKEGWIGALHAFCRRKLRMPLGAEIAACKQEAKDFDRLYAECVKGRWPQARMLEKVGAAMLQRRHELTDMVLHGVVK